MSDLPVPTQETLTPTAQSEVHYPVSELNLVLRACNPAKPLSKDDPRRVDLTALRHDVGIGPLRKRLQRQLDPGEYHHSLLCGHRGSGKSTELLALEQWANEQGFLAVRIEVNERYGIIELDYSDLFLLAAVLVEQAMEAFEHPLPQDKIQRIIEWFRDVTQEDAEERKSEIGAEVGGQLGGKLPFSLGSLFVKLTAIIKGTTTHSLKTRETMRRYPDTLIDSTTDLLETANATLVKHGMPGGLLLIFDNLDRYTSENVDTLLVRSSQQVRKLACHAIFTFPISLAYRPITGRVSTDYGLQVVLPMLALRSRSDVWADTVAGSKFDEQSVKRLREALACRVQIDALFAHPPDVDLLVRMSGGAIRDLIQLVASASNFTEDEHKITSQAVQRAINELRSTYMRLLTTTPYDYRCLASIAKRESLATHGDDFSEQINRLLFNGCLLEYMQDGTPWHDVHPVLIEVEEFQHACAAHDRPGKSA